ncbi:hypothetical protein [Cohnella kolymensis]|nr:hypothetical protein [Cohnella kolymensis]
MERDMTTKKDEQPESKTVMQLVEEVDTPPDVDRGMVEVMEDIDE